MIVLLVVNTSCLLCDFVNSDQNLPSPHFRKLFGERIFENLIPPGSHSPSERLISVENLECFGRMFGLDSSVLVGALQKRGYHADDHVSFQVTKNGWCDAVFCAFSQFKIWRNNSPFPNLFNSLSLSLLCVPLYLTLSWVLSQCGAVLDAVAVHREKMCDPIRGKTVLRGFGPEKSSDMMSISFPEEL